MGSANSKPQSTEEHCTLGTDNFYSHLTNHNARYINHQPHHHQQYHAHRQKLNKNSGGDALTRDHIPHWVFSRTSNFIPPGSNMDYVIEIQGFRDIEDHFILKEVAILTLGHDYSGHWIAAPPYPFTQLSTRAKHQNNWLSCYYHGIEWFEGDVPYKQVACNLREVARTARRIYTRGREKARLLQDITTRRIINLEEVSCPPFKKLPSPDSYCFHHGVRKEAYFACALNNATILKIWLEKTKELTPRTPAECSAAQQQKLNRQREQPQQEKQENQLSTPVTEETEVLLSSTPITQQPTSASQSPPPVIVIDYEQPTGTRSPQLYSCPDQRCLSCGSNSCSVDETDGDSC